MDFDQRLESRAIFIQACAGARLVLALAFHIAEVGIIGLSVIIIRKAPSGITEEHRVRRAFQETLPFTALLIAYRLIDTFGETTCRFPPGR